MTHRPRLRLVATAGVGELVLHFADEKVAEEETAHRVLNALAHLQGVVDDLLCWNLLHSDATAADEDHEVESGNELGRVLHALVQLLPVHVRSEFLTEVALHSNELITHCIPWRQEDDSPTTRGYKLRSSPSDSERRCGVRRAATWSIRGHCPYRPHPGSQTRVNRIPYVCSECNHTA